MRPMRDRVSVRGEVVSVDEGVSLGKVCGFRVGIHWSVAVIVWLFAWSLASTLPGAAPGHSRLAYWLAGGCGAALLAASLLAHELTHAVVAKRAGVPVSGVTLWLFGGIARLGGEAKTPGAEFRIAAVGPALSLALSAVFAGVAVVVDMAGASGLIVAVLRWLAVINAVLAIFNLLPGAPLDGGRILRAYLWHRHGDAARAAIGAARAGCAVAYSLIALGLFEFFAGSLISGARMAFVGWFLLTAARDERSAVEAGQVLVGMSVADVMTAEPHTAADWISAADFIRDYLLGDRHSAYPVVDHDGSITGLITLAQLRGVPADVLTRTPLHAIAIPRDRVSTADTGEPIANVVARLATAPGGRILVMDAGRLVGILTPADVARLIDVRKLAMAGRFG